ncbi:uncharacterized protein LOC123888628 isoform X1 [Trifolium pratense]|uniref:uncharacterized protein LOC123888628 isoform X1 n=1 Tax=Trifolium pratense TaxID=57577 RepID=UPI001E69414E|nr:uncharacterized protein LOC123888628 isoform X1 [Trifolium pratense]XP_045793677.1 uncharacterized protein LOC123888628 isoform X1 [Trifolium pratense]
MIFCFVEFTEPKCALTAMDAPQGLIEKHEITCIEYLYRRGKEFRPRELRWQFAVTPPCLAMEVMKPFSPSFLWFKMYSLADPSGRKTTLVAMRNSIYLIPLGILAYDWGVTSGWFCLESTALALALAISAAAFSFYRDRTKERARRMFHASLLYLPVFGIYVKMTKISEIIGRKIDFQLRVRVINLWSTPDRANPREEGALHMIFLDKDVEKLDLITAAMGHALATEGGFCTRSARVIDHQVLIKLVLHHL